MNRHHITQRIAGRDVTISCAVSQEEMAHDLLTTLEHISLRNELRAGVRIRFGWSILTLCNSGDGGLIVCEPDFVGDPIHNDERPQLDTTLDVLARQTALVRRVGVAPVDVGFEQYIVVGRGALMSTKVQLFRETPSAVDDSGWSIIEAEVTSSLDKPDDFYTIHVFELLSLRSSILPVLVLPPGFAALFDYDLLIAVFDTEGKERLHHPKSV